jgi:hypothetical protein
MFHTYPSFLKFHILLESILQFLRLFFKFLILPHVYFYFCQQFNYNIFYLSAIFFKFNFKVKPFIFQ